MKKALLFLLILLLLFTPACAGADAAPQDGQYSIELALKGGSGRAGVDSPAMLTVSGGQMTATIVWSSPFYEWMQVDGVRYSPIRTDGNATFVIPITMDADIPVSAQTVAMSEPHVIEYTLYFDSKTLQKQD